MKEITEKLQAYLSAKSISQNQFAKMCGVASGTLGYILKGIYEIPAGSNADGTKRYSPVSEEVFKRIERAMGNNEDKHWDTYNYKACINLLLEAKKYHEHRIIDGPKGSGKSYAARAFQSMVPNETFIVTASEDMGPKDFMIEVANVVGVPAVGSRLAIRKKVAEKLKTMRNPQVIVDEGENLRPSSYGSIKALYDEVFEDCSIVLIGANNYLETIKNRADRGRGCMPQIYSRFSADPVALDSLNVEEARKVCAKFGITDKAVVSSIIAKSQDYRELDRNIKRYLRDQDLLNNDSTD
ncbi:MAG TPA: AAA family ATPase [Cytophagales bacterium]|nr:AAA family ATPase [Cytophagales bacterium]